MKAAPKRPTIRTSVPPVSSFPRWQSPVLTTPDGITPNEKLSKLSDFELDLLLEETTLTRITMIGGKYIMGSLGQNRAKKDRHQTGKHIDELSLSSEPDSSQREQSPNTNCTTLVANLEEGRDDSLDPTTSQYVRRKWILGIFSLTTFVVAVLLSPILIYETFNYQSSSASIFSFLHGPVIPKDTPNNLSEGDSELPKNKTGKKLAQQNKRTKKIKQPKIKQPKIEQPKKNRQTKQIERRKKIERPHERTTIGSMTTKRNKRHDKVIIVVRGLIANSSVYLDGKKITPPIVVDYSEKRVALRVVAEGYMHFQKNITLTRDQIVNVEFIPRQEDTAQTERDRQKKPNRQRERSRSHRLPNTTLHARAW